jgi:hypothetical protein
MEKPFLWMLMNKQLKLLRSDGRTLLHSTERPLLRKSDERVRLINTDEGGAVTKLTADAGALLPVANEEN